jgi:hypothetical protein
VEGGRRGSPKAIKAFSGRHVIDRGVLHGGFSIRYIRSTLPEAELEQYDDYIGETKYA